MIWPPLLVFFYCVLILLASLAGGWLPMVMRLTHTRMQVMISFVAGLMLGVGLFHMLVHGANELGSLDRAVVYLVLGLLTMFFLVRIFHFHEHAVVETDAHEHDHDHACHHPHAHEHHNAAGHPYRWLGVAIGLSLHTALDGMALAATVASDARHDSSATLLGVGTFLAVLLHKPLDAMSITALMSAQHWPPRTRMLVNAGFALMCPLGATLFWLGLSRLADEPSQMVGAALAFSAGLFVCIALGDLLPELQFHSHDRLKLSIALLAGVACAYAIGYLEPAHRHDSPAHIHAPESHTGHSHDHKH